jgi:tetratricopeptide (TPR) repeat protein
MATKKFSHARVGRFTAVLMAALLPAGCAPSGPKALLQGERLIREGKPAEAVERLQIAVQLLPENPQAWNHLGMALHSSGRAEEAARAYHEALNRNPNLAAAHFNLGMLSLERNDLPVAISELTSHAVLRRESVETWSALGSAQLRAKQFDAAEKSFQTLLQLKPGDPEALNGLGMVQAQRRRIRDAATLFSNALRADPNFAPALLNLAVLMQPFDTQGALQRYRAYVQLKPAPANAAEVGEIIRRIESEIAATQARMASLTPTNTARIAAVSPPATNTPPARPTPPPPVAVAQTTNTRIAATSPPATPVVKAAPPTNHVHAEHPVPASNLRVAKTDAPPKPPTPAPTPAAIEIRQEPPSAPAREIRVVEPPPIPTVDVATTSTPVPPPTQAAIAPATNPNPPEPVGADVQKEQPEQKPSLVQRLNPAKWFGGGTKSPPITTPLDPNPRPRSASPSGNPAPPAGRPLAKTRLEQPKVAAVSERQPVKIAATAAADRIRPVEPPSTPSAPPVPRYTYLSPSKPAAGNRAAAERALTLGVQAHEQRRLADALQSYREAVRLDPGLFEAQHNLGLVAHELKDWPLSLSCYERALSINPTSVNARFNFALALERAGYPLDAAGELEKIIAENPAESRAHFSLAKIYSEDLHRRDSAARLYLQTLRLEPNHPQAAAIRRWLMENGAR